MDAATVETAKGMGWPWDAYAEAVYARIEAERAAELAFGAGDPDDRARAAFDLEEALGRERTLRGDLADVFLLLLRSAVAERPGALFGQVQAAADEVMWKDVLTWLVSSKPGGAEQWLAMSRRVAAAEDEAKRARAETWRLANALAALEQRMAETERPTDAARNNDSEGEAAIGGRTGASDGDERQAG